MLLFLADTHGGDNNGNAEAFEANGNADVLGGASAPPYPCRNDRANQTRCRQFRVGTTFAAYKLSNPITKPAKG